MALLPGCAAVAVTAGGVGMATGVSHTLGGIVYKTFAAPEPKVRRSTMAALACGVADAEDLPAHVSPCREDAGPADELDTVLFE